jgi:hypothetical protein
LIPHIRKALARPGEDPAAASRSHVEKLPGWTRCSGFVVSTLVDGPGRLLSDSHDVFWNGRRGRSLESWRRSPIVVALIAVAGLAAASAAHAHLERPTHLSEPGAWRRQAGRDVELPAEDGPRAARIVERDGQCLAAIIHDRALLERGSSTA